MAAVPISDPGGYVTTAVLAIEQGGGAQRIGGDQPLPVQHFTHAAPTPLAGSTTTSGGIGPYAPELGRPIWLTLGGTWTGTVTLKRPVDGGTTRTAATIAGQPLSYAANLNEPVAEESETAATWWLEVALTAGTLTYRVAQ